MFVKKKFVLSLLISSAVIYGADGLLDAATGGGDGAARASVAHAAVELGIADELISAMVRPLLYPPTAAAFTVAIRAIPTEDHDYYKRIISEVLIPLLQKGSEEAAYSAVKGFEVLITRASNLQRKLIRDVISGLPCMTIADVRLRERAAPIFSVLARTATRPEERGAILGDLVKSLRNTSVQILLEALHEAEGFAANANPAEREALLGSVVQHLANDNFQVCTFSVKVLASLSGNADRAERDLIRGMLVPLLKHVQPDVREATIRALGRFSRNAERDELESINGVLYPMLKDCYGQVTKATVEETFGVVYAINRLR